MLTPGAEVSPINISTPYDVGEFGPLEEYRRRKRRSRGGIASLRYAR
jgi:hypothetical protein